MDRPVDIHKAGGIIIRDRKVLVTRTRGKDIFINPGGKLEPGEGVFQALKRELKEELGIEVEVGDVEAFGTYHAQAAYQQDKRLRMDMFLVKRWQGKISPCAEVEEIRWVNSQLDQVLELGSILEHDVLPQLKAANLID